MQILLEAKNIVKFFGDRKILDFESIRIYQGDRIGILGVNGAGKSTLLDILAGKEPPDGGMVIPYCGISYLPQLAFTREGEADPELLSRFLGREKASREGLSGGEETRLRMAEKLSPAVPLLFADEPTSNLDWEGRELFYRKLWEYDAYVVVSHERKILRDACNRIIWVRDGGLEFFSGNYDFFKEQLEKRAARGEKDYKHYVEARDKLRAAIDKAEIYAGRALKAPKRMGNSEARLYINIRAEANKHMQGVKKAMASRLEKMEVVEKPREQDRIKLDFSLTNPPGNKIVIRGEKLSFSYDGKRPVFHNVDFSVANGQKVALWGENGSGKTTLLNLIFSSAPGLSLAPAAKIGFFHQKLENLHMDETILGNVMKESVQKEAVVRTILARLLFPKDSLNKKAEVLSGGERMKLSLAKILASEVNMLFLDEPTNFLDAASIEVLEEVIRDYRGTVLLVSHDRDFVEKTADSLLVLREGKITAVHGRLSQYLKGKKPPANAAMEKMVLEMELNNIAFMLSKTGVDREALEAQYNCIVQKINRLAKDE